MTIPHTMSLDPGTYDKRGVVLKMRRTSPCQELEDNVKKLTL